MKSLRACRRIQLDAWMLRSSEAKMLRGAERLRCLERLRRLRAKMLPEREESQLGESAWGSLGDLVGLLEGCGGAFGRLLGASRGRPLAIFSERIFVVVGLLRWRKKNTKFV